MTRFCVGCKAVVSAKHGRIVEIDGKKMRTCEPEDTSSKSLRNDRPVLQRLQKKLKASRDIEMSKMMTVEQAEEENAKLPEGYRYVLADILDSDGRSNTA